jgi:hypothetical protein
MYNRFGPTARTCFDFPKSNPLLNGHRAYLQAALSSLSSRVLQGMVEGLFDGTKKADISHTFLLLKRLPGADWSLSTVEIITPDAEMALRDRLRSETQAQRIALYNSLASVEVSRHLAGVIYEMLA